MTGGLNGEGSREHTALDRRESWISQYLPGVAYPSVDRPAIGQWDGLVGTDSA